jgi:hypothetical protein
VPLSNYKAADKLGITPIMLSNWIKNRHQILRQRKGSRRARGPPAGREEKMEIELHKLLEDARGIGRQITHRWFTRHAKEIYRQLYPHHAIQDLSTKR